MNHVDSRDLQLTRRIFFSYFRTSFENNWTSKQLKNHRYNYFGSNFAKKPTESGKELDIQLYSVCWEEATSIPQSYKRLPLKNIVFTE